MKNRFLLVRINVFPKLELGMSVMLKDDLADSLAYNNLKVEMF